MSKTAFVLSGGGAKGSFQVGVLTQLAQQGIIPDALYGTSTGALNSCGYSYLGINGLLQMWRGIKSNKDIMVQYPWFLLPFYLAFGKGKGVYSMKPLEKKIQAIVTQNEPKINATVCRVSLKTSAKSYVSVGPGQPKDENFARAVLASASTPLLNDVVDGEWVDGGVRQITPLEPAVDSGATEIYVILAEPFVENIPLGGSVGNAVDVLNRSIACMVQEMFWQDIQSFEEYKSGAKLIVYAPDKSLIDTDDFDPVQIEASIQQGLSATPVLQK